MQEAARVPQAITASGIRLNGRDSSAAMVRVPTRLAAFRVFLHMATVAQHHQILSGLILLVTIFVMDVEPPIRYPALLTVAHRLHLALRFAGR